VQRSSTWLNWSDRRDDIEWEHTFTAGFANELLDDRRYATLARGRDLARGYGISLTALGGRLGAVDSWRASAFLKQPIRGNWLYVSIGPEVRWDREHDWHSDVGARLSLDFVFWDLTRGPP
jgi:hypothetical protein